jgi:predicted GIY-YIG superfamily endonuclease
MCNLYILKSLKDESHYIGYTSKDVKQRLNEHNNGKSKYTKAHRPYRIIATMSVESAQRAKLLEKYFKNLKNPLRVIEIMGSPDQITDRD